jgi:hypothetical protein
MRIRRSSMMKRAAAAVIVLAVCGGEARAETGSLHFGYGVPEGLSAGLSVCAGQDENFFDSKWGSTGTVFQLSAGTAGGRISVGKGSVILGAFGYAVKGTLLQTWGRPLVGPKDALYFGPEAQFSAGGRLSVGILKSVSGPVDTPSLILTATVGIGF